MKPWKNVSIHDKLSSVSLLTITLVLLISMSLGIIYQHYVVRDQILDALTVEARIIGHNSSAALMFNDSAAANEILSALRENKEIEQAIIYDEDGAPFASYLRKGVKADNIAEEEERVNRISRTYISIFQNIIFEDERVGDIFLRANLDSFYDMIRWNIVLTGSVMFLALLFAHLFFSRLVNIITDPLESLLGIIKKISSKSDYTLRAPIKSQDEIGILAKGFNEMIEQIDTRDRMLQKHKKELETTVSERTDELKKELVERKAVQEKLDRMAHIDEMTSLPNRASFLENLPKLINFSDRHNGNVVVMFIDLNNFKRVNDTLGHDIGDKLLQEVASRLSNAVRKSDDTVFRLGGDEFTVLSYHEPYNPVKAAKIAQRIIQAFYQSFMLGGHEVYSGASIGISVYPENGKDINTILKNADTAMYQAKEENQSAYVFYTPEMNEKAYEQLSMENSLRKALVNDELILHYQPQVATATKKVIGMEALIRWHHPEQGIIPPTQFIHVAEESGFIEDIGSWVLKTACEQNRKWQLMGLDIVPVAVNLSAKQFKRTTLLEEINDLLDKSGLEAKYLELELTESIFMEDADETMKTLKAFKSKGVKLSIDDFGTGYSSLSYLKRFPIDKLKIDISFVQGITNSSDDEAITSAIIALGHNMNLKVIAEGIETKEQFDLLSSKGCDEIQGFYYYRPLPTQEMHRVLQQQMSDDD